MIKFEVSKRNFRKELLETKLFDTLKEAKEHCNINNLELDEFYLISKWDNVKLTIEDIEIINFFGSFPAIFLE